MNHTEFNQKGFLLPESINSCASYHYKVFADGKYLFRLHDCEGGIRLLGDLNTPEGVAEAKGKINELISSLIDVATHLDENYPESN